MTNIPGGPDECVVGDIVGGAGRYVERPTAHPHRMATVMQIASRPYNTTIPAPARGGGSVFGPSHGKRSRVARNGPAPVQEAIDLLLKVVPAQEGHREKRHPMIIEVGDAFWLSHRAPQSFP